jgi:anti-anti-sigma regulatory factor
MKTRKKQTPVTKRERSRPVKRGATRRRSATARGDGSLTLAAECTVAESETLKAELMRRLGESDPVIVDVSGLQRIDTAGLQLLAAFVRDRRTAGLTVAWRGRAPPLDAAAGLLGLHAMLELPREAER